MTDTMDVRASVARYVRKPTGSYFCAKIAINLPKRMNTVSAKIVIEMQKFRD